MLVDDSVADPVGSAVIAGLAERGFPASSQGPYIGQLTMSDVPGKSGLFAPTEQPASEAEWLLAPSQSRSITQRVAVLTFSDRKTGQARYRIVVSEPRRAGKVVPDEGIAKALLSQLDAGR